MAKDGVTKPATSPATPLPPTNPRETRSRESILAAARQGFAAKGFAGARVDQIAAAAGANKQLVYYYFGSKQGLYQATLEAVYAEIRSRELLLNLGDLPPDRAMEKLVAFSFDHLRSHPEFIKLLNDENRHGALHLQKSSLIQKQNSPLIDLIELTLRRGEKAGLFRSGVNPLWLYVSIAGMAYFFFSNNPTLSTIFGRDLSREAAVKSYRGHVIAMILAGLAAPVQPNG